MFTSLPKIIGFILLVSLGVFLWSWINSPLVVTVVGQGEAKIPATQATLSFSVVSSASDSAVAISEVKAKVTSMKQLLKNTGISEDDIMASQVTVSPPSVLITGATNFTASVSLGGQKIPVTKVENLISSLYVNGAVYVSQPTLSFENQDLLEEQAFNEAMKDAQRQADIVAKKDHKFIKKIIAVTQVTTPASTVTSGDTSQPAQNALSSFKIYKQASVSYKMW